MKTKILSPFSTTQEIDSIILVREKGVVGAGRKIRVRSTSQIAGPIDLSVKITPNGLEEVCPGLLGENLFMQTLSPLSFAENGPARSLLTNNSKFQEVSKGVVEWIIDQPEVSGKWTASLHPEGIEFHYHFEVHQELAGVCPLALPINSKDGWLLLPDRDEPLDLTDQRLAKQLIPLNGDHRHALGLNSQGGFILESKDGKRCFDGIRLERVSSDDWQVGFVHGSLGAGTIISGTLNLRIVPFNGVISLEKYFELIGKLPAKTSGSSSVIPVDSFTKQVLLGETDKLSEATLFLSVLGETLSVKISHDGLSIAPNQLESCRLEAVEELLGGKKAVRVNLELTPSVDLALRFDAELTTPCGNPTWDGDASIHIPGNMARCNYHPGQTHGGGPKWGPSPLPEGEKHLREGVTPGRCHGWTFPASRLPQVWTAAEDRHEKVMFWMGTTPRSQLGENCAGFISPQNGTTALRLATPTTYDPWIPLGYSRMRQEDRKDVTPVLAGEKITWSFWVIKEETEELNAWAGAERALYLAQRPHEPVPIKISRDEAIQICASAIHEWYYRPEYKALSYATGPRGRHCQIGFTGMGQSALVMHYAGKVFNQAKWYEAGKKTLNTMSEMFRTGPYGFPWLEVLNDSDEGNGRFKASSSEPGYATMCAFDNMVEALRRENQWGNQCPDWEAGLKICADMWVQNQSPEGAYPHNGPNFMKEISENIYQVTNVEAGVMANMADAYILFGDEKYLASAQKAALYYGRQLDDAQLYGGPGDIHALVNSEVPMFFLRGFRRLYQVTKDEQHKKWMLSSAAWRYAFQFAHSWAVDKRSDLWKQGWAGLGCEGASACNLHAVAFGCINIPDYWELFQITGDEYHRMRCEDLSRYSTQQYARFAGDLGFPFAGAGTESWWATDTLWGKGYPHIFKGPGLDLGYMSWVTGWSGYGALWARELDIDF
jgi:hypothetical protein